MSTTPSTRCTKRGYASRREAGRDLRRLQQRSRRSSFDDAMVYFCEARECQYHPFHIGHDWSGRSREAIEHEAARRSEQLMDDLDSVFAAQMARVKGTLRQAASAVKRLGELRHDRTDDLARPTGLSAGDDVKVEVRK